MNNNAAALGSQLKGLIAGFVGIAAARQGVRTLLEYEEAMAMVNGIAIKATASAKEQAMQFAALTKQTRELGAITRFSATEAAQGQLFLARAGFSVQEIISALPGTLDLASAGAIDLGRAADIASNVLTQFRLEAEEMGRVGDVLASTFTRSNTDLEQLSEALKMAGPVASQTGLAIEEASAALGILGQGGLQASLGGTQLRGVLLALAAPTAKARKVIQGLAERIGETADQFDITKESADGLTTPLQRILELFAKAEAAPRELEAIFGRRQFAGASTLIDLRDQLQALTLANQEAEGTTKRLAEIQEDTLAGAFRRSKAALEELILGLGERGIGGTLRDIVQTFNGVVRSLAGTATAADKANPVVGNLTTAVKALLAVGAAFVAIKLGGAIAGAGAALVTFATGPIGIAIAAIGGLIALFMEFKDDLVTVGDTTASVGEFMALAFDLVAKRIAAAFRLTIRIVVEIAKGIRDVFTTIFDFIDKTFFKPFRDALESLGVTFSDLFNGFVDVVKSVVNTLIGLIMGLFNVVAVPIARMIEVFTALIDMDIDKALDAGDAFLGSLSFDGIGESFMNEFQRDFIGEAAQGIEKVGIALKEEVATRLGPEAMDDIDLLFNPERIEGDIKAAFALLREERAKAIAETRSGSSQGMDFTGMSGLEGAAAAAAGGGDIAALFGSTEAAAKTKSDATKRQMMEVSVAQGEILDGLEQELSLLGLTETERRTAIDLAKLEKDLEEKGIVMSKEQRTLAQEEIKTLHERIALAEQMGEVFASAGQAIGRSLEKVVFEGGKARDIIKALIQDIARAAFRSFVTNQIVGAARSFGADLFGGAPSATARGAAYVGGVESFARGGTLDRGMSASMAAGIVRDPTLVDKALIGEGARAEGIFPLEKMTGGRLAIMANINGRSSMLPIGRLGDGNLGVRMSDGIDSFRTGGIVGNPAMMMATRSIDERRDDDRLGRRTTRSRGSVTINQTITTPNPDAFRKSQSQIIADGRRAGGRGR